MPRGTLQHANRRRLTTSLACILLATGCTMGPDYVRPPVPEITNYREPFPQDESIANIPWWEVFSDTILVNLVETSLENNRDLRATLGRIDEARAAMGIVRSDLFPRIDYGGDGGISGNTAEDGTAWDGVAAISARYQLDLWGRIRRSNEAALMELLATEEAYRGLTITLVSEVASSYVLLLDIDNRLSIAEATLKTWEESLEVIRTRHDAGMVSEVDVNQAEIQVYEAQASVHAFDRLRGQTENAINLLLGLPPTPIARGYALGEQEWDPAIPAGLPSDLLTRRPDVVEAERRLHAQTARIGVAQALKFPQFNLLGDLGGIFDSAGNTGFFNLGAEFFGPLFNAGANQRQVEVEMARTEQLVNRYEQTILAAYREVNDAMIAVRTYRLEYGARALQTNAARNAAELSWVRYEGGLTSYLEVLDVQRSLFSSELKASEALQLELSSVVRLYVALGGGWVPEQNTTGAFGEALQD